MTRFFAFIVALAVAGGASAQEIAPVRYQGGDISYFSGRLLGEFEKVVEQTKTPASELSPLVVVAFRIDTTGVLHDWRYIDNTCAGRDSVNATPATPRSRELMSEALTRLDGVWTPARRAGRAIEYTYRLTLPVPVEKISKKQNPDPLLFLGMDPDKSFHPWATNRVRYDARFSERGVEGLVDVRFYVEPDGRITIGEVVKCPDEKLAKEVVRVIKSSKGKWTPRKVRGVPQRTAYNYRVNYFND